MRTSSHMWALETRRLKWPQKLQQAHTAANHSCGAYCGTLHHNRSAAIRSGLAAHGWAHLGRARALAAARRLGRPRHLQLAATGGEQVVFSYLGFMSRLAGRTSAVRGRLQPRAALGGRDISSSPLPAANRSCFHI